MVEATVTSSITDIANRLELLLESQIEKMIRAQTKLDLSAGRNDFLREENQELTDTVKMQLRRTGVVKYKHAELGKGIQHTKPEQLRPEIGEPAAAVNAQRVPNFASQ